MLFFEEIVEQDSEIFMGSLDVDTLENNERVGLTKKELKELSSLATKEAYFIFNGKLYTQVNRIAMC